MYYIVAISNRASTIASRSFVAQPPRLHLLVAMPAFAVQPNVDDESKKVGFGEVVAQSEEMLQSLRPVSIVVAGRNNTAGKDIVDLATQDDTHFHPPIDVRQWMHRDPCTDGSKKWQTPHEHNSENDHVACELMNNEEFFTAVDSLFRRIVDEEWSQSTGRVWVLYCSAGQHRSDGCGRAVARMLNHWPVDSRRFNVNIFSVKYCHAPSIHSTVVADAIRWSTEPWCIRGETSAWGDSTSGADHATPPHFRSLGRRHLACIHNHCNHNHHDHLQPQPSRPHIYITNHTVPHQHKCCHTAHV